ncbi:tripartite tricarboxylate transporter substrate binding protein [Ramlibacter sp. G-1-2-2]|uniref:Tripartite tricarboxylate transporter substrate binding protein n=1 Tax=Ramlibacter agri TaxID=2728837 RepID=A0A848GXR2_9BURK|nr:tripartite tricarboxylate transporter substrate binding protein [Ramlibacter agri]NML43375.1 tripartite tricarboxylate transporter substrate binding protein [Ramlibacter agri]
MTRHRKVLHLLALGACALSLAAPARAQDRYPVQAIRIVVPYPPGGTTDFIARNYADALGHELGQAVVVDNKPGGGTNIGAEMVARAKPDGYTLLLANNSQVLNPVFGPNPSFELSALEPVSLVSRIAFVIAANPKVPVNNPAELLAAAKAQPGKLSVSSAQLDLYVELLNNKAGIKLLHVPYKGGAPATMDAISGQVNMVFALTPVLLPHIQAGKLKPVAVTSGKRLAVLPDVPTLTEQGIDYDISIWYGVMAPAGTPRAIVDRLAAATKKIMATPDMVAKVRGAGAETATSSPEEFQAQLKSETAMWQQTAKVLPHLVQK